MGTDARRGVTEVVSGDEGSDGDEGSAPTGAAVPLGGNASFVEVDRDERGAPLPGWYRRLRAPPAQR